MLLISIKSFSQDVKLDITSLDSTYVDNNRSATCSSPDNVDNFTPILPPTLTYAYLNTNGYCYTISPITSNFIGCYTMTATATSVYFNTGLSTLGCGVLTINYVKLYTSGTCILVASPALGTVAGLTIGTNYTWCVSLSCNSGGFTQICPYFNQATSPLPIELTSFTCQSNSDNITINWITATETNNNKFQLMRSTDGIYWKNIVEIKGAGTSSEYHNYSFVDYMPTTNTYYYKLVQIDYNGKSTMSKITSCSYTLTTTAGVTIKYYNMIDQLVDINNAVHGFYIKEYTNGDFIKRELFFKN